MAPKWLNRGGKSGVQWLERLYLNPMDSKLSRDRERLKQAIDGLVEDQIDENPPGFERLSQTAALLFRIRLYLQLWLSIAPPQDKRHAHHALEMLASLRRPTIQVHALCLWALSNRADAPEDWKAAARRRGMSAMPWRAAVSFSEDARFDYDGQWAVQYRLSEKLREAAHPYGGMAKLADGLTALDPHERRAGVEDMTSWLNSMGEEIATPVRDLFRTARRLRFNQARIDAHEDTIKTARRIAQERARELARLYYGVKSDTPTWDIRFKRSEDPAVIPEDLAMEDVKSVLSLMHPKLVKSFKALEKQSAIYRPEGRGGGFTVPIVYSNKARVGKGPFIHAPFDGGVSGLRTLAHEVAHGVHAVEAAGNGPLAADAGWALSETVALTAETLVLSAYKSALKDQDFAMLVQQPAIYAFQRAVGEAQDTIDLDGVWVDLVSQYYGSTISLDGYDAYWKRTVTTASTAGYPIAYTLGWALAGHTAERLQQQDKSTQEAFLNILRAGGVLGFDEAAQQLGVSSVGEMLHSAYDRAEARLVG